MKQKARRDPLPLIRYGKASGPLLRLKQNFFDDNTALLARQRELAVLYRQQERRAECMTCGRALGEPSFSKMGVDYVICASCGHLNGAHKDTDTYCHAVYTENGGAGYATTYSSSDHVVYQRRVRDIYLPKAQFLLEGLESDRFPIESVRLADLGAGSGYFLAALRSCGIVNAEGYEVSERQIELANSMVPEATVHRHDVDEIIDIAGTVSANVVSMIGVLEHLQRPRAVVAAIKSNSAVRYLYFSVPLFSPSVFIEMAFPGVMQRHLSGGHTHLYTQSSLNYLCNEFELRPVAEWWFGTDIVDLYRSLHVALDGSGAQTHLRGMMLSVLDDLQLALDRHHLASQVHMLVAVKD